ncbi:hypothetical protein TELCIR_07980 [Teladorsagia circumcincta]|uniref:Serine/threonine specific protein phosphatases domain-containing protein n=2 Tax=Teladorsagia circumcincta TaxID=45464 RepID=A0A2G9UJ20_TELCI|nr:hypothetical protein TELCIR_07980 [Teladorsagia circumcincta]
MAGLVGSKIFCAHGGISEDLVSFKQVYRPTDICDIGLLCDLIWSDPSSACSMFDPSPRGVSSVFGKQAVNNFCTKMHVDLICRAHQCVMDGYEFFADKKCLTLFSAPCYCGELDNQAAVLHVSGRLECRVLTFKRDTGMATAEYARTVETPASGRPGIPAGKTPVGSVRKEVKGDKPTGATRSTESAPVPANKAEKKNNKAATPRAESTQATPGKKTPK